MRHIGLSALLSASTLVVEAAAGSDLPRGVGPECEYINTCEVLDRVTFDPQRAIGLSGKDADKNSYSCQVLQH